MDKRQLIAIAIQSLKIILGIFAAILAIISFNPQAMANAHWLVPLLSLGLGYFLYLDSRTREDKANLVEILGKIRGPLKDALQARNAMEAEREFMKTSESGESLNSIVETRYLDDINVLSDVMERWQAELGIKLPDVSHPYSKVPAMQRASATKSNQRAMIDRLSK